MFVIKNRVTDFMRNGNMEEDMAEDRKKIWQKIEDIFGVWKWMDGSWLYDC